MEWNLDGVEITDHSQFDDSVSGFIYQIIYDNGQEYIGKKLIRSIRKVKPTKQQLSLRKNYSRKELKNLPFRKYNGSCKNSNNLKIKKKNILELCADKINLSYCETKWLMRMDVLNDDKYLNENIAGTYFKGKINKGK